VSRHPLHPLPPDEQDRILAEMHLTHELLPIGQTGGERNAALAPQEPAMPPNTLPSDAVVPTAPSFVPPKLRAVAVLVASIGGLAMLALPSFGAMLPAWVGFAVFALTAIASFLAGLALPTGLSNKPIVPLTAVPTLAAIATALGHFSAGMPDGTLKAGVQVVAALLFGLAGVVMPAPGQVVAQPETPPQS
jgi:hypothetical protein